MVKAGTVYSETNSDGYTFSIVVLGETLTGPLYGTKEKAEEGLRTKVRDMKQMLERHEIQLRQHKTARGWS